MEMLTGIPSSEACERHAVSASWAAASVRLGLCVSSGEDGWVMSVEVGQQERIWIGTSEDIERSSVGPVV